MSEEESLIELKKQLKMERLTSLEDEIIEDEKLRKFFELFPSDEEEDEKWTKLEEEDEEKSSETL